MKPAILATAAGLISLGIIAATPPALASSDYKLSPAGNFTGDGNTSATKNGVSLPCKAHFTGTVSRTGVGHITSGSFKDNGGVGCTSVGLQNLPWKALAKTARKVVIYNVQFTSPIGNCGPGNLPVKAVNGVVSFTDVPLAGGCTVSGKITTNPTVSIVLK